MAGSSTPQHATEETRIDTETRQQAKSAFPFAITFATYFVAALIVFLVVYYFFGDQVGLNPQ